MLPQVWAVVMTAGCATLQRMVTPLECRDSGCGCGANSCRGTTVTDALLAHRAVPVVMCQLMGSTLGVARRKNATNYQERWMT